MDVHRIIADCYGVPLVITYPICVILSKAVIPFLGYAGTCRCVPLNENGEVSQSENGAKIFVDENGSRSMKTGATLMKTGALIFCAVWTA